MSKIVPMSLAVWERMGVQVELALGSPQRGQNSAFGDIRASQHSQD